MRIFGHMKAFISFIAGVLLSTGATAQVAGTWSGKLELTPQVSLELVINLPSDGSNATFDSPDQGAYGLPLEVEYNQNDSIAVASPKIGFFFSGRIADGNLTGTFRQGMVTRQLTLTAKKETAHTADRPQTPRPPYPYTTKDVEFDGSGNSHLCGTLTLPDEPAPGNPTVLMISGSGLQDRDETVMGHRPFAVISDYLARHGIASLRYDDRGTGSSTGDTDTLTTAGNIADARAAIQWLRSNTKSQRVGAIGHSEGGRIAFAIQSDFIVAIAAPASRGDTLIADQNRAMLTVGGMPEEIARMYETALLKVVNGTSVDEAIASWNLTPVTRPLTDNLRKVAATRQPWLDYFMKDDPAADIAASRDLPVIAFYGNKDTQVTATLNAPRMSALNPIADIRVIDGLNHMMQHCSTGAVTEYAKISETIAPEVLEAIARWILGL